jgi:hypothetical protein
MNVLLSNLIRLAKCGVSSSALFYTANSKQTGAESRSQYNDLEQMRIKWLVVRGVSKIVKAPTSYVCLSARMEQLSSHWTDFREIWFLSIFRKSAVKIKFH